MPAMLYKCKSIIRLLVGESNIRTHKVRRYRLPREEMLCTLCNNGEIQDEKHVIFQCRELQCKQENMFEALQVALDVNYDVFDTMSMCDKLSVILENKYGLFFQTDIHKLADVASALYNLLKTV
jgi:hypothetical protein